MHFQRKPSRSQLRSQRRSTFEVQNAREIRDLKTDASPERPALQGANFGCDRSRSGWLWRQSHRNECSAKSSRRNADFAQCGVDVTNVLPVQVRRRRSLSPVTIIGWLSRSWRWIWRGVWAFSSLEEGTGDRSLKIIRRWFFVGLKKGRDVQPKGASLNVRLILTVRQLCLGQISQQSSDKDSLNICPENLGFPRNFVKNYRFFLCTTFQEFFKGKGSKSLAICHWRFDCLVKRCKAIVKVKNVAHSILRQLALHSFTDVDFFEVRNDPVTL